LSTFGALFVPAPLREAVSDAAWLAGMVDVERALVNAAARAGVVPADAAAAVAAQDGLVLRGLMAVAPIGVEPRRAFAVLPGLRAGLLERHPAAGLVSAGMSGDLEAALACGATHLRVGTAVLGARPPLA